MFLNGIVASFRSGDLSILECEMMMIDRGYLWVSSESDKPRMASLIVVVGVSRDEERGKVSGQRDRRKRR